MAGRRHRCPGGRNRIIHWRRDNLSGPFFTPLGDNCFKTKGNYLAPGKPGAGPRAVFGIVIDATTIQVRFSLCVSISAATGIEYNLDGGAWTPVSAVAKVSDTVWNFTTGTINPGDEVRWRYIGGSGTIVDCTEAADIGDQETQVTNPLVLEGDFILLETGGQSVLLLENAAQIPDDAYALETRTP